MLQVQLGKKLPLFLNRRILSIFKKISWLLCSYKDFVKNWDKKNDLTLP